MKLSPSIYAKTLIGSAKTDNLKTIARKFWYKLQKNKQYKDLPKILDQIDFENAKAENKILAKIYSKIELSETEKQTISDNLKKKFQKEIILKNISNKNITGVIVKVDDRIIDMSLEGKLEKLKRKLVEEK